MPDDGVGSDTLRTCPSAPCEVDSIMLGVRTGSGRLAYINPPVRVTDEVFVELRRSEVAPERRFRFASTCTEADCGHWTGRACGLSDLLVDSEAVLAEGDTLPACSIRSSCRWFFQNGRAACRVCPLVVTDSRAPRSLTPVWE